MRPPFLALAMGFAVLVASVTHAQDRNRALELNATVLDNDYVSLSNKTGLAGPTAITVEAWVHPTSYAGYPTIVGNDFLGSYWFGLNTSGNPRFYPTGGALLDASVIVPLNEWTHLAATYDGTTARIFRNGVQVATSTAFSGPIGSTVGDLRIGADRNAGTPAFFWRGYLDEVRIWNVARTASQLMETMYVGGASASTATPPYAGLRSYWTFESGTAPSARDSYSSGRTGTMQGTASFTFATAPSLSYNIAIQLDGATDYWDAFPISGFDAGLTLMAWIAPRSTTGANRAIVAKDFTTSFYLGLSPEGRVRFYPRGGVGQYIESNAVVSGGRWTHVAATYTDGIAMLYLNGRLDRVMNTITGPVGENAVDVFIGADRSGSTPNFFFDGWLDEVKIIGGELGRVEILRHMTQGGHNGAWSFVDATGRTVEGREYPLDIETDGALVGSSARFVRSGAPLWDSESPLRGVISPADFRTQFIPPLSMPENDTGLSMNFAITVTDPGTVTDLECFVVAPSTRNDLLSLRLVSPLGTEVRLVRPGDASGRDIATNFNDEASLTLAAAVPPYVTGVRPSDPLSTFDGESITGDWRLYVGTTLEGVSYPGRIGLWAWGIRFGAGTNVGVERTPVAGLAFRSVGANPTRGSGAFAIELPRATNVELALFDPQGRRVRTLMQGPQPAGATRLGWSTEGLEAGTYFAKLRAESLGEQSLRITVMK